MVTQSSCVLLRGGSVYARSSPGATALLVVDGHVAWVGTESAAASYLDSAELVVELGGRLLTPGFVDAHAHLGQTGFALQSLNLGEAVSVADAVDQIRGFATTHGTEVLFAYGWDETHWPERRPVTQHELDSAVGDRVAYVARVDSHSAVVSSALVAHDPSIVSLNGWRGDGRVERDAHHAARAVTHRLWTPADREHALRTALAFAASRGITSIHELNAPHIAPYSDFAALRGIAADTAVPEVVPYWGAFRGGGVGDDETLAGFAGDLCVDGAVGSRTACMHAPYADEETSGHLYLDREQIADHVVHCTERDLQAGFHVIGDRAMTEVVAGLQAAATQVGEDAMVRSRHRLEHVEMATSDEIDVLARLGVVASVQPAFDAEWGGAGGLYEHRLGADRSRQMNPLASMRRAGLVLAFGSDSPITPFDPWAAVRAAASHSSEEQRRTVEAAFDAHTRGGHRARRDDESGVLEPGARATYAVWDLDGGAPGVRALPSLTAPAPLPQCVQTVVNGATVFTTGALPTLSERR